MAPALISGFKPDPNQRQSPTIRETPKRLAATRAEQEQAAAALALSPPAGGVRYTGGSTAAKRTRAETDDVDANTVLSNGSTSKSANNTTPLLEATVKPDPENVNPSSYTFQTASESNGGWASQVAAPSAVQMTRRGGQVESVS